MQEAEKDVICPFMLHHQEISCFSKTGTAGIPYINKYGQINCLLHKGIPDLPLRSSAQEGQSRHTPSKYWSTAPSARPAIWAIFSKVNICRRNGNFCLLTNFCPTDQYILTWRHKSSFAKARSHPLLSSPECSAQPDLHSNSSPVCL